VSSVTIIVAVFEISNVESEPYRQSGCSSALSGPHSP